MTPVVRTISASQHRQWIASRPSVSFLQLPEWGRVKVGWRSESIGWFEGSELVGAGLVLFRPIPKLPQRSLAYLPEGPDIDWLHSRFPQYDISAWLTPLLAHLKASGAFQVKMGPPVPTRRWESETIKSAMAQWREPDSSPPAHLHDVVADWHSILALHLAERLESRGWRQEENVGAGFGDVQPRYVFQVQLGGRTLDEVFAGFNQLWRRNVRKAEKLGVQISLGERSDLAAFHEVYVETAKRDHFTPRALSYFERMWDELNSQQSSRLSLHLAHFEGHLAAATLMVQVGDHAWYSYGASTTADRDVRPSNALQWAMITRAHEAGCTIYDLRGIADTLNPDDHLFGLVQFKVGSGGYAQEYVGEWDFILRASWAKAYALYQSRRS
ncbi:MAG: peptidoglycan bridge formation glycyltransferase FemA/FemB family protein [Actinomycetota bacterium]|nr:peptidoglycan bridge formation glycyltransferase FemA/FemB family protein [Actinomycetota bacterium]